MDRIVCLFHVELADEKRDCRFRLCVFQAEDGIRDLVRSRGLGDVYKRQERFRDRDGAVSIGPDDRGPLRGVYEPRRSPVAESVSYTHLTLPTSDLV